MCGADGKSKFACSAEISTAIAPRLQDDLPPQQQSGSRGTAHNVCTMARWRTHWVFGGGVIIGVMVAMLLLPRMSPRTPPPASRLRMQPVGADAGACATLVPLPWWVWGMLVQLGGDVCRRVRRGGGTRRLLLTTSRCRGLTSCGPCVTAMLRRAVL